MFAEFDAMISGRRAFCRLFLSLCVLVGAAWAAQAQQTFTVTKTADTNNSCNPADCSLREAILAANSNPGADIIAFKIGSGPATITPLTKLPTISESVVIDATTQPGFAGQPIIEISGVSAPANTIGLNIAGDHVTVRGLVINRFSTSYGISVGGIGHHTIAGNFVGTDLTGTIAQGNFTGIGVSSPDNVIGGTTAADRNIISGNASNSGLGLAGASSTNNRVLGNYIGTDVTGTIALGNNVGVYIIQAAGGNIIGGSAPGSANLISGNFQG